MNAGLYLRQVVGLVLVYQENVTGLYRIKTVVNEELPAARNRVINLVAVMNVHFHRFFFFIQVCDCKGLRIKAALHGTLTGCEFFHREIIAYGWKNKKKKERERFFITKPLHFV